jgi:hypothetical protein
MSIKKTNILMFLSMIHLFVSCENHANNNNNNNDVKTGNVTFLNESRYNIKIHRDSFSGPVLLELSANAPAKTIPVRVSDNNWGTVFSIEYLYRINDGFDTDSGEVIASGIDPNIQIPYVIEENKSITVQIPDPPNPEFKTAFIKILNAHNLPCELKYYGRVLQQNNGNLPIAPGKTGIYKESVSAEGELYSGYTVATAFESVLVPDFTVNNGFIYSFTYDGSSVHDGSLEKKPEPKIETIVWR